MQAKLYSQIPVENCPDCEKYCKRQERTKLVAVKRTLYNPHLTTFKRSEIETNLGKLADEHSRTTLPKAVADLPPEIYFNYNPSCSYLPRYNTLPLPTKWIREDEVSEKLSLEVNEQLKQAYLNFKGTIPFRKGRVLQIPQTRDFHFLNYKIRYMRPEERQKWRLLLEKEKPKTEEQLGGACHCKIPKENEPQTYCIKSRCDEVPQYFPQNCPVQN